MRGDCGPRLPHGCYPRHVDSDASARASVTACRRSCACAYLCSPTRDPGRFCLSGSPTTIRNSSLTASVMSGRKNANGQGISFLISVALTGRHRKKQQGVDKPSRSPLIFAPNARDLRLGTVAGANAGLKDWEISSHVAASGIPTVVAARTGRKNVTTDQRHARRRGRSCLLYTSPSPRDATLSRMPSSA